MTISKFNLTHAFMTVCLTVAVILGGWQLHDNTNHANKVAHAAATANQQNKALCETGNQFRSGQLQLWQYILDIPPSTPQTPAQQQVRLNFEKYVQSLFAPRRCS